MATGEKASQATAYDVSVGKTMSWWRPAAAMARSMPRARSSGNAQSYRGIRAPASATGGDESVATGEIDVVGNVDPSTRLGEDLRYGAALEIAVFGDDPAPRPQETSGRAFDQPHVRQTVLA